MVLEVRGLAPPTGLSRFGRKVCQTVRTLEALEAGAAVSEGKWLRAGQVAKLLGVSVNTARNYIDAGKFRRVRRLPAGDRRVWSEDVDAYVRELEHPRPALEAPDADPSNPDPPSLQA